MSIEPSEGESEYEAIFRIEHIQKVIDKAKGQKCQDCLPYIYLVPHDGVWIIINKHDPSCPSRWQNTEPIRWDNL